MLNKHKKILLFLSAVCFIFLNIPAICSAAESTVLSANPAEDKKHLFIQSVIAESDNQSEDITSQVTISPSVLYEGTEVILSGLPDTFSKIMIYPYGSTEPYMELMNKENNLVFTMPGYDVEIICEETVPPLHMNPADVYTPNTDVPLHQQSRIANEPSMEVQKSASWTNIQAGEAMVTIEEYDLNQYTNVPCDYIIMVDCSATMETIDPGASKSRYALANEAITKLLDQIQIDNTTLSNDQKSRVAFMTYSGSGDNGKHPTFAQYQSSYYNASAELSSNDYDYFLSGVYEYSGFTTDLTSIKNQLNLHIRRGSKINMALDKVIQLLQEKGSSIRKTKIINVSDCGNGWYGPMREGYFSGNIITDWLGVHNDQGVTAQDKVDAVKNTYGAYFMQICIGPTDDQRNITRTSVSDATGDHLFWTYDGTETRFLEIFNQIHDIPYEITASQKQITDLFDTTYWDIMGIQSCSTGMNTVSLSNNKLIWNIPDGTAGQKQTCTVKLKLKDHYRYLAASDTSYRTNADSSTPGLTYRYVIKNGILDGAIRNGAVTTPSLKYGTVEFRGNKVWTVSGSHTSNITITLYQKLPGYSESAIETISLSDPVWSYSYTNAARQASGKHPYVKYNNTGQIIDYRIAETTPSWYTQLPSISSGNTIYLYNEPLKIKASIIKTDFQTGNVLSGAVFEVYQWSTRAGKYIAYKGNTSGLVNGTTYESGTINGRDSIMQMTESEKGTYITPSWLYYTPDNEGKFAVIEAKAPYGYYGDWRSDHPVKDTSSDDDKVLHTFSILADGSNHQQTVILSDSHNNERVLGEISFTKKDKESGLSIPQGNASLENASYHLYAAADIIHADGGTGILYTKGEIIHINLIRQSEKEAIYAFADKSSGTTDPMIVPAGGKVTITGMELGNYYLLESHASEGYLLNSNPYHFSLTYQNEKTKFIKQELTDGAYEQVKKQSLSFCKVTYDNPDIIVPLEDAGFSVYLVSSLNEGIYASYTNEQIEQAIIDDYRDPYTLLYDSIKKETPAIVYEEPESDDVHSQRLVKTVTYSSGETHHFTGNNGYLVSELVSSDNGIVTLPSMPYGRYVVVETTTPKNKISTRPFVFCVTADEIHGDTDSDTDINGTKLESKKLLVDRPISSLIRIEKTDAKSNQVILKPGAKYIIHDLDGVWFDTYMSGKTSAEKKAYQEAYGDLVVQYAQGCYLGSREEPFITKRNLSAKLPVKSTYIDTVLPLPSGTYELEEILAPDGYVLSGYEAAIPKPNIRFSVSSEYAVYDPNIGQFITIVRQPNEPAIGKISVYAEGEMLEDAMPEGNTIMEHFLHTIKNIWNFDTKSNKPLSKTKISEYKNYQFNYTVCPIEGAEFTIYAAEDIYSPEYDAHAIAMLKSSGISVEPLFTAGDMVAALITDQNGQAWTGGTKGLPLGKYHIVQTKAGDGFALTEENRTPRNVTIAYAGQTVPVIYRDEIYQTPRQKVCIEVKKTDQDTGISLSGAVFGLYAAEDIINRNGKTAVKSDTLVAVSQTSIDNIGNVANAVFDTDLPLAKYYIRELNAPDGYVSSPRIIDIDASYQFSNENIPVLTFKTEYKNVMTQVQINLMDYNTEIELDDAQLQVLDSDGIPITTILTRHNDNMILRGLSPKKNYTLKILSAREGYLYTPYLKNNYISQKENSQECKKQPLIAYSDSISFSVEDTEKLQTVSVFQKPLTAQLIIQKKGPVPIRFLSSENGFEYRETGLPGAEYTIKAAANIVHPDGYTGILYQKGDLLFDQPDYTGYTDTNGLLTISDLPLGIYEVTEVKAPEGYHRTSETSTQLVHLTVPEHISERPDGPVTQTLLYSNQRQQPGIPSPDSPNAGLTVIKYGINENDRYGVEGAEFILYAKEDIKNIFGNVIASAGTMIEQAVSDVNGIARFSSNIPIGVYEVKETKAPDGYYRSDQTLIFHLDKWKQDDSKLYINDTGCIENSVIDIRVKLVDDISGAKLANACLQVLDKNDNVVDAWITNADDEHKINDLIPGQTYRIREILPRDHYLLSITDAQITAEYGELRKISDTEITFTVPENPLPLYGEIVIKNPFKTENLIITKSGEQLSSWSLIERAVSYLQSLFHYTHTPLKNVEFSIFAAQDIIHPDGITGVLYHSSDLVETHVRNVPVPAIQITDTFGIASFHEMYPGNYIIKETLTPEGFLNGEEQVITLPSSEDSSAVHWINLRQPVSITITKRDILHPEQVLEGAVFGLYNKNDIQDCHDRVIVSKDTLLEITASDKNGIAAFQSNLPHGMYYIKELHAPAGYTTNSELIELDASYCSDKKEIVVQEDFFNEREKEQPTPKKHSKSKSLITTTFAVPTGDHNSLLFYVCLLMVAVIGIYFFIL